MIVVTTGVPGAGKTLYAITWVKNKAEKENRPVYYSGIKDLQLPWTEIEAEKWADCPPNSIVVIDECQRVFRPRMHGANVPPFVAALETHRHQGIDLVFITQHPMLIDQNVRRLCGLHFHVMRKWGTQGATVHEWPTIKETCDKNRSDSVRHEFRYPKANFALYKSAEVHTHKARIPYHFWIICAVPFLVGAAVWKVYTGTISSALGNKPELSSSLAPGGSDMRLDSGVYRERGREKSSGLSTPEFLAQHVPRVRGLAYTAPVYDAITTPTEAPYPAACVSSATKCTCYTQQATRLDMPEDVCRTFADKGFFVAWLGKKEERRDLAPQAAPVQRFEAAPEDAVSITASGHGMFARPSEGGAVVSAPVTTVRR